MKVVELIKKLNEIGYDDNTKLEFGCVDGNSGEWYEIPFYEFCYGEKLTGHPYCNDYISLEVDMDSVEEYGKTKAESIIDDLIDDLHGVLRNYFN